jgi:hypothetical protein
MNPNKFRGWCSADCGNAIKKRAKKYCSLSCLHRTQKKPRGQCLSGCGRQVKLARSHYCSYRCMHAHRHAVKAQTFITQGGVSGHVPLHFLARVLRDFYGERCMKCGWAQRHEKTGKVPVEIEHIDGNWRNNRLTNLTLLCPNCHALTPTFRGLNRGRGRALRLGGRANPKKLHVAKPVVARSAPTRKVCNPALMQLPLMLPT